MSGSIRTMTVGLLAAVLLMAHPAAAEQKNNFTVAWTTYVGWMPWDYAQRSGILAKWAGKYGIRIELVRVSNYLDSVNQYAAGRYDACLMTNLEMLTLPAARGVDSTAIIIGDYSNGNDGVVLKGAGRRLQEIKGQSVNLVLSSVSDYLLQRALQSVSLTERDVKVVNTSDAEIVRTFASPAVTAAVAWKPQLYDILNQSSSSLVFDSSRIPGEILDLLVVNTSVLKDNPRLARALTGAWYETLALMQARGLRSINALTAMARASGTDLKGFRSQLDSTYMYWTPAAAVSAANRSLLQETMDSVRRFAFQKGLLGPAARTVDAVGIEFPGGKVLGDPRNIQMRFDTTFMKLAADGKL